MKAYRTPLGCIQNQWLDNFDKSLTLPTLFWAQNPPENAWVCVLKTMSSTCSYLWSSDKFFASFCRKTISPGIVWLQLLQMLILMRARNGRRLPDLCCIEKFHILMPASKYMIFYWFYLVCLSFLIQNLAWLGSNIFRRMKKIKFKTSVTRCRVVQKELVDQPPSHL